MDTQRLATTESEPRPVPLALPTGPRGRPGTSGPGAALIRGTVRDDRHRRPAPAGRAVVAEVSDSTLCEDRFKPTRCAGNGAPVARVVLP